MTSHEFHEEADSIRTSTAAHILVEKRVQSMRIEDLAVFGLGWFRRLGSAQRERIA
jgi:hypothetical protein